MYNECYADGTLTKNQGSTGNVTIAYEAGVTGEVGVLYTDKDGGALWQSALNVWQLIGFPKYNLDTFNTDIATNNTKVGVTTEEANPTDAEIVASIDSQLGNTDWKTGGQTPISFKIITDGYYVIPTDGDNVVLLYDGATDITINIDTDASAGFTENLELKIARKGDGDVYISYTSSVTGEHIKTVLATSLMRLARNGADRWLALDGYETYEYNYYNLSNAAGDDTDSIDGFSYVGAVTRTSIASTDTFLGDNYAISLVLNQAQSQLITSLVSGLTVGNQYEARIRARQPQGSSQGFTNWSNVTSFNYQLGAIASTWEERLITFTPTNETIGINIYIGAGTDNIGDAIEISKITITDITI